MYLCSVTAQEAPAVAARSSANSAAIDRCEGGETLIANDLAARTHDSGGLVGRAATARLEQPLDTVAKLHGAPIDIMASPPALRRRPAYQNSDAPADAEAIQQEWAVGMNVMVCTLIMEPSRHCSSRSACTQLRERRASGRVFDSRRVLEERCSTGREN